MPALDVIGCTAAIASAFHGAAELVKAIQDNRDKKRRRKDRELEHIVEEKLLYKSLLEGENRCRLCSADRYQRFGEPFAQGDELATSQLKDVVIAMHGEVIQALQTVRKAENISLDLTALYEASITNRRDAIRAMDELCQRIMIRADPQTSHTRDGYQSPNVPLHSAPHLSTSPQRDSFDDSFNTYRTPTMPLQETLSQSPQNDGQRSVLHRLLSSRHSPDLATPTAARKPRSLNPRSSPPRSVPTDHDRVDSPQLYRRQSKAHKILGYSVTSDVDCVPNLSRHSSIRGDADSYHRATSSISSSTASDAGGRDSISDTSFLDPIDKISLFDEPEEDIPEIDSTDIGRAGITKTTSVPLSDSVLSTYVELPAVPDTPQPEDENEALRALSAPEVLTAEVQTMDLNKEQVRPPSSMPRPAILSNIHPAFRDFYRISPISPDSDPANLWEPLARPAKHNEYHGFCKGAWQCRKPSLLPRQV